MKRAFWLGGALLLGFASAGLAANSVKEAPSTAEPATPPAITNGLTMPREDGPIVHGVRMSVSEAESRAESPTENGGQRFVLYRPDHPLANDSGLNGAYFSSSEADVSATGTITQVGLDYGSGLVVIIHRADVDFGFSADAKDQYEEMAANLRRRSASDASVQEVLGVPALVIDRREGGSAAVDLVIDEMRIKLYALYTDMDAATLIKVAETLTSAPD